VSFWAPRQRVVGVIACFSNSHRLPDPHSLYLFRVRPSVPPPECTRLKNDMQRHWHYLQCPKPDFADRFEAVGAA
jgi:hypothetical protein